jgi:hypothetical protein
MPGAEVRCAHLLGRGDKLCKGSLEPSDRDGSVRMEELTQPVPLAKIAIEPALRKTVDVALGNERVEVHGASSAGPFPPCV